MTLAPLDAPLVHLGGITTGRWAQMLEPEGPTVMSWGRKNHWAAEPAAAWLTSPDERDGDPVAIDGSALSIEVAPRTIQSVRVVF